MSRSVLTLLAAVCAMTFAVSTAAEAARRKPLNVTVQKRSIFDLGNVVPVGSLNRYASQHFHASPAYANTAERYGEGTLPSRIGSGSNPFAGTWASPRW
jgi:hypothetical protein